MRRTLQHVFETIAGRGDSDSVTRRIRHSLAHQRSRPANTRRGFIAELVAAFAGRQSAQAAIRHLALRKRH